ncbi:MAG: NAD(P)-binding protein, partial [Spirochaetales bacterium]|nr:NAD(P)-binding protein [Spirochaetales bacterium]
MVRTAVVGAGPVGSVVAAVLASSGHDVAICEIADGLRESIRSDGITLRGARTLSVSPDSFGALHSGVESLADDPPEILFLCVK